MSDVVVTVPARRWDEWLNEGDLPGEPWSGMESFFRLRHAPMITIGERVYVVARGHLRGYAPLVRIDYSGMSCELVRRGKAVAVTIAEPIRGFRGFRYRWWDRADEVPYVFEEGP
jgi:hypothetical protein